MIKEYLHYRRSIFFLYLLIIIIFPLIHLLNGYSFGSIGYSILLTTFLLGLWLVFDVFRFTWRKCKLDYTQTNMTTFEKDLPKPYDKIEEEYQHIIVSLYNTILTNMEELEKSHIEQVEYYTMWVHQIKMPISAMRLALYNPDMENRNTLLELEIFKIEQYVELALQYTKLKDISSDLVIKECLLEEIVRQSIKKYAPLFINKKLSVQIMEFHTTVTTDNKWFSFILEQLLSNSIKYTNQGGIEISYKEHSLFIKDTGIGIRSEDKDRIFEKGYTGYNGRLDMKASGIGLYLVKKVADALSLEVEITSTVGCGTTARILLPKQYACDI